MNSALVRLVYYDSRRQPAPYPPPASDPQAAAEATEAAATTLVDLATEPDAAQQLARLGISAERDLPALAMAEAGGKVRLLGLRLSGAEIVRLLEGKGMPAERLVVYSSSWCPDCRNAKRVLHEAETSFEEVDIDQDPAAEALVLERSGGRRVVPTLRFGDRLWAFNPAPPLLRRLLATGA
jgi:glutaredoxin